MGQYDIRRYGKLRQVDSADLIGRVERGQDRLWNTERTTPIYRDNILGYEISATTYSPSEFKQQSEVARGKKWLKMIKLYGGKGGQS